jgi:hypothetical protein
VEEWRQCELAEFKKKEEAQVERQVAKIKVAKEKAGKEKVVSKILKEMPEKGKKRARVEDEIDVIMGDALFKDSVMWEVKAGKTCDPCSHMGCKCYWRDSSKHAMACYSCHFGKKVCRGVGEKQRQEKQRWGHSRRSRPLREKEKRWRSQ